MREQIGLGAVVVALVAVWAAFAPAGSAAPPLTCKSGLTVTQTKSARVFEVVDYDGAEGLTEYYGCLRPRGRVRALGYTYDLPGFGSLWQPRISTERVAFIQLGDRRRDAVADVVAVNLRTGRTHTRFRACDWPGCQPPTAVDEPTALGFRSDGALAWIWRVAESGHTPVYEVYARARLGGGKRLDRGTGIEPRSLRITRNSVRWTRDGTVQQAPLRERLE